MEAHPKFRGRVSTLARRTYRLLYKAAYQQRAHTMTVPLSNVKRTMKVSVEKKEKKS